MPFNTLGSRIFKYGVVDAFSDRPFSGNPAAVVIVEWDLLDSEMQQVAAEFNLSETAFLTPTDALNEFGLRWFTPTSEVKLCGHATLAASVYLAEVRGVTSPTIGFDTLSGRLVSHRGNDGTTLDFPATPITPFEDQIDWVLGLGSLPAEVWRAGDDVLVVFPTHEDVVAMVPQMSEIAKINCRGVIVTAPGVSPYTCTSRMFAPRLGISEDPVTGSAHCALAVYWQKRLGLSAIRGFQASARTGHMDARHNGDRVALTGTAHLIAKGELFL